MLPEETERLLLDLCSPLCDHKGGLTVRISGNSRIVQFFLRSNASDAGRLIGKGGEVFKGLKQVVSASSPDKVTYRLEPIMSFGDRGLQLSQFSSAKDTSKLPELESLLSRIFRICFGSKTVVKVSDVEGFVVCSVTPELFRQEPIRSDVAANLYELVSKLGQSFGFVVQIQFW